MVTTSPTHWLHRWGGIGIAPGANISDQYACFEATHGTAPKYAGLDKVNPGSILSAEMMLRHLGWKEAANLVIKAMEAAIADKQVTYDFARLMDGATEVSCHLRRCDDRPHVKVPVRLQQACQGGLFYWLCQTPHHRFGQPVARQEKSPPIMTGSWTVSRS